MYLAKSFMTLYMCLLDEIKEQGKEGSDALKMTSAQVCGDFLLNKKDKHVNVHSHDCCNIIIGSLVSFNRLIPVMTQLS